MGRSSKRKWLWMSFVDDDTSTFLGVVITKAHDVEEGAYKAWALGINPGGQVACMVAPNGWEPPKEAVDRLLSRAELELFGFRPKSIREYEEEENSQTIH